MNFKPSSLSAALLWPFVGLVAAVALVISGLSYLTGLRGVATYSSQILSDVSYRVAKETSQHLQVPRLALNSVAPEASVIVPGATSTIVELAPQSFEQIEQRLWLATGLFANVSGYVYFGAVDGRFIGVNRSSSGTEVREKLSPDALRIAFRSSGPGLRGDELRRDQFDTASRPWYKSALAANNFTWSPIYVAATSKALTLTLAKPVRDAQERLLGVAATDMPLSSLSEFVAQLKPSDTGIVYIVDGAGDLVASSVSEPLVKAVEGKPIRLRADQSENELIRASFADLLTRERHKKDVAEPQRISLDTSRGIVDVERTTLTQPGLSWSLIVAIPRSDHMDDLRDAALKNALIGLVAIIVAILLGLWMMHRVSRDVSRLSEATRLLASGRAPAPLEMPRTDELGYIAQTMNQLGLGLVQDPLTGALNRATFERRFDAIYGASGEPATSGALVFVDLNDFKRVNDAYGHTVGDALLSVCAQRLMSYLRRNDALCRFGGDEFLILMTEVKSKADVDALVSRCRAGLAQAFGIGGHQLHLSAAFGYAMIPEDGKRLTSLIDVADRAMYQDKTASGRREDVT